ncbi:MAG: hypothetical protein K2H86_00365 [Muribaculaceae bacterium]|nr:hypothetical protein [Muribaculaceae bacterium]
MVQIIVSILMLSIIAMLLLGMNRLVNGDNSLPQKESDYYKKEIRKSPHVIGLRSVFSQFLIRKNSIK